jgi:RND family efflux transporter MFP subunit
VSRWTLLALGAVEPWLEAKLGPQHTEAYVDTVLVRPGAPVKRGQVVAMLDCRNASAQNRRLAMRARALEATQAAMAAEAARVATLLGGGYVSQNEAEKRRAASDSKAAELQAAQATARQASLEVDDCVLRAPFDGEVARRSVDPGAFVRPGTTMLTLVDRTTVRVTADVPETDYEAVRPGTPVDVRIAARLPGAAAAARPRTRARSTRTRSSCSR